MPRRELDSAYDDQELQEFRVLFDEYRRMLSRKGPRASQDDPIYKRAIEFVESKGWIWGKKLVQGALLSFIEPESALELLINLSAPRQFMGFVLSCLGIASHNKGEYDEAIRWYEKALATPGYEGPGDACHNMGLAYDNNGEYDEAIRWYEKALATPGYERPGNACNNMGLAYDSKGEYDEAIRWYEKALATPGYEGPGDTRHNIGVAYDNKGEYDEAMRWYQEALATERYDCPSMTLNNIANIYRVTGEPDKALETVQLVLDNPDDDEQLDRARYISSLVEQQRQGLEPTPGESSLAATSSDPTLEEFKVKLRRSYTSYDDYCDRRRSVGRSDEFVILRDWSSATPLLDGGTNSKIRGGGYFMTWRGRGLVVDPGLDFIDNFHDADYHSLEIDAVIVSHDHADHNADLRRLDDLFYEVHRRDTDKKVMELGLDADTAKRLEAGKDYRNVKELNWSCARRADWFGKQEGFPFIVEHFIVTHSSDVPNALGFRIKLLDDQGDVALTIGYTGDTEFSAHLVSELAGVDILLGHVSQPVSDELDDATFFKRHHLGLNGMAKLIEGVQPQLVLVGEFWSGIDDLRMDIVKWLRTKTGMQAIFPASRGLSISLPEMHIRCSGCNTAHHFSEIRIVNNGPYSNFQFSCERYML